MSSSSSVTCLARFFIVGGGGEAVGPQGLTTQVPSLTHPTHKQPRSIGTAQMRWFACCLSAYRWMESMTSLLLYLTRYLVWEIGRQIRRTLAHDTERCEGRPMRGRQP